MGRRLAGLDLTEFDNPAAAQIQAIRREQGRMGELQSIAAAFVEQFPQIPAWRMALAMIQASTGQLEAARVHIDFLARDGFDRIPRDGLRLTAVAGLAGSARYWAMRSALSSCMTCCFPTSGGWSSSASGSPAWARWLTFLGSSPV
jgi:hypothetical protein